MIPKCTQCRLRLAETKLSKGGKGPLKELRCPKCKVLFYINRRSAKLARKKMSKIEPIFALT